MDNNVAYSGQGETFERISFGVTNKVLDGMIRMIEERRERGRKILRCT